MEWTKIDFNNLPSGEVLAANFKPKTYGYLEKLLGYLSDDGTCSEENTILENCTHYIDLNKYDLTSSNSN